MILGLVIITLFLHGILGWKMWHKKRKLVSRHLPSQGQQGIFTICRAKKLAQHKEASHSKDTSLLDHLGSILFLGLVVMPLVPFFSYLPEHFKGAPLILVRLSILSTFLLVLPLSIYIRKPHVRSTLHREVKDMF